MRISDYALKNLNVETESGENIGKIKGMVIDTDSHQVIQYLVIRSRSLPSLLPSELMIHFSQVVSVTEDRMVIHENTADMEATTNAFQQQIRDAASAVPQMSREKA